MLSKLKVFATDMIFFDFMMIYLFYDELASKISSLFGGLTRRELN
jgi:hypothetical protein